jgi:glucokinase
LIEALIELRDDALTDPDGLPPALRSGFDGALAVACLVSRDKVALTDLGWSFSTRDLRRSLGLGSLKVVNDFAATAMAPDADVFPAENSGRPPVGSGSRHGTGRERLDTGWTKMGDRGGEGGHVTLPSASMGHPLVTR